MEKRFADSLDNMVAYTLKNINKHEAYFER